jgi:NhaA family Na+:H+ antiporter
MVIPVRPMVNPKQFVSDAEAVLEELKERQESDSCIITDREQLHALEFVHTGAGDALPAGLMLEHALHPVQVWLILPLFALANAGVRIDSHILEALANPISLGIIFGLVLGKPVGITALSWLVVKSGKGSLPSGVNWTQIVGAGCLAGIGFTMSLFIAALAWTDESLIANAKIGILAASLLSGVIGYVLLSRSLPKKGS